MKRQYLYVYTCRKHVGFGRHFGYTGITNSPWHRDQQHRAEQPWSDLIIRRRVIPLGRIPRRLAEALEWVLIKVTLPAYNVQHNRTNPRRVTPHAARLQRAARDGVRGALGLRTRLRVLATARLNPLSVLPVLVAVIAAVALWR